MTTQDLKSLFLSAYDYAEKKYNTKPDSIQIEEDGTIKATWSIYTGCGEYDTDYELFTIEDITKI